MNKKTIIKAISYISLAVVVATAAGCASTPRFHERVEFVEAEYLPFKADGNSTVSAEVKFKPWGINARDMKTIVYLNPVTSYSKQWYEISFWNGWNIGPADQRQATYIRVGQADGQANKFVIKNVPAGEYYLTAFMSWQTDNGGDLDGMRRKRIAYKVRVKQGEDLLGFEIQNVLQRGNDSVGAYLLDNELGTNPPAAVK